LDRFAEWALVFSIRHMSLKQEKAEVTSEAG
jgi:hypothetical protein